jgi:hypothetical protein
MKDSPQTQHAIEQYLALSLEVQATLASHQKALIAEGWHPAEAWALCQRVEERILGPAIERAEAALADDRTIAEVVADAVAAEREKPREG